MERLKTKKTQSATLLFLLSFIIGALCIFFTFLEFVFPLAIVFVYSASLYIMNKTKTLTLSSFDKNTPYYLGLLFSLFSLFSLSVKSGFSYDSPSLLLTTMSIALSTTILGLILRQILLSFSPPDSEDYIELLKQIQIHSTNLQEAFSPLKNQITNITDEFNTIKKTIQEKETNVTSESLEKLRNSIFSDLEGTFSKQMKAVLDSVSDFYIEDHETTIGQILPDSYKIEISERWDDFYKDVLFSLKNNSEEFLSSLSQLSLQVNKDFQDEDTEDQIIRVNKMIRSYEENINSLSATLEKKLSLPDK